MNQGLKIKLRRIEKGYKQYEFAELMGISREYLRQLESNISTNPSKNLMIKIANTLNTTPQELFFED